MQPVNQQSQQATTTEQQPFDGEAWLAKQVEQIDKVRGTINLTDDGIEFGDFAGVQRYARMLIKANLVPEVKSEQGNDEKTLARVTQCLLLGRRVGIPPEEACQSIYIVNNRATIFGTVPLALARRNPEWVEAGFQQYFEVDGKRIVGNPQPDDYKKLTTRAVCETLRKGGTPLITTFSVADVNAAVLWDKPGGVWKAYTHRMMQARARGYNLQDNFGDSLKGLTPRELVDEEEPAPRAAPLPEGSIDLRTLRVSPPIPPSPPVSPPPPPVAPVVPVVPVVPLPPPPPPATTKKRAAPPVAPPTPPPAPTLDACEVAIEEMNLINPLAFSDWLGKRGLVPEDVENSRGEKRAEFAAELDREVRRLSTAE